MNEIIGMMRIKEYGSDFHLDLESKIFNTKEQNIFSNKEIFTLFFSGRSALYSLLYYGIRNYGWKKVYFPSYYCHEVTDFIKSLNVEIEYYLYNPFLDDESKELMIRDTPENVIINVSFFGLKKLKLLKYTKASIIDDFTHDISMKSDSRLGFGSLRKQLPLPCGGAILAKDLIKCPDLYPNFQSNKLAIEKIVAMHLKTEYLEGRLDQKDLFRSHFIEAEKQFGEKFTNTFMPQLVELILNKTDIDKVFNSKRENLKLVLSLLKKNERVIYNFNSTDDKALGLILQLKSFNDREKLKAHLISKRIYPAILWPGQFEKRDVETEKKVLFLHLDYRYDSEDVIYIADVLNEYYR